MIKQIITTTTLLAASVAMANAGLTLEAKYVLGEVGWNTSITNYNTTKQFSLVDATPNGHDMMNWGSQTAGNYTSAVATTIPGSDSTLSLGLNGAGGWSTEGQTNAKNFGSNPAAGVLGDSGLEQYIIRFDIKLGSTNQNNRYLFSNGYDNSHGTGLALTMNSAGALILGQNKAGGNETDGTKAVVSNKITAGEWTRLLVYVDNSKTTNNVELYKSTDGVTKELLATVTNEQADLTKLKFLAGAEWTAGLNGNNNFVDDLRVYSYDLTGTTKGAILAAAIPEPSMFGLLAGLGALALVGARRRRK